MLPNVRAPGEPVLHEAGTRIFSDSAAILGERLAVALSPGPILASEPGFKSCSTLKALSSVLADLIPWLGSQRSL